MINAVIRDYGLHWIINRVLYDIKLRTLNRFPFVEKLFEKNVEVKRIDIFSVDSERLAKFLVDLSDNDKNSIIKEADKACLGKIRGFSSSIELDYGNPINWQLNPLTEKKIDSKIKWFRIPDFDKERGDIKVIWEISRFSHLLTFARAYCLTTDKKYYFAFSKQIDEWVHNNEYSFGANYKCGQECSIRMVNVLLAGALFKDVNLLSEKDEINIKTIVRDSYKKVLANFFYAYRCIKNNHTLSELMGMVVGAWCCNDEKMLKKTQYYLNKVVEDQFEKDGGYVQYSFNYQRLALMDLSVILSVSDKTKVIISEYLKQRVLKSSQILFHCQATNYDVPNYGSNDGALIFKMTSCSYRDFRPVCNTIYRLIEGHELYIPDKHQEELIWLNIEEAELNIIERQSIECLVSGLCSMRDKNNFMMIICNDYLRKRPGHMDQMHIDLWVNDINVLCDGGTYSYASIVGQQLIDNRAHNTVVVEGRKQMSIRPPFMIYDWPKRLQISANGSKIVAKSKFKTGYTHTRIVKKADYGYEVIDTVDGREDKEVNILFHTICDIKKEGSTVLFLKNGNVVCRLITSGKVDIENSIRSLYYFESESIKLVNVSSIYNKEIVTQIIV